MEITMSAYLALIHKEAGSDYGVSFPDFPGCITAGSTLDEARANAAEALAFHIEGMVEDGEALPAPSALEAVMRERHNRDAVAFLVDVPARPAKAARVNITLPDDVLREIDAFAEREGYTRSGLIVKAVLNVLLEFSINAHERTILHKATNAIWRYGKGDGLTLLYAAQLDSARLAELEAGARHALREERRRTMRGGRADKAGRVVAES